MCGGGGGSDKYSKQMMQMEKQRQAKIAATQAVINSIFSDPWRETMYSDAEKTALDYNRALLDDEYKQAQEKLTASLARRGLIGGSAEVSEQQRVQENFNRELGKLQSYAVGQGLQLRSADEQAKQRLLGLATSGIDTASAAQSAYSSLGSSLALAKEAGRDYQIGDLLSGLSMYLGTKLPSFAGQGGKTVVSDKEKAPWEWGALSSSGGYGGSTSSIGSS